MVNRNIDLPSKRAKIVMDIEKPLRRKFRSETEDYGWLVWLLLALAVVYALHVFVEPHLTPKAEAATVQDDAYYCQHLNDYDLGSQAKEITKYCASI